MVKVIITLLTDCVTPFPFKRNSAFSGFGQPEFNAGLAQGGSEETAQKGTQESSQKGTQKSSQKLIELIRETPSITIAQLAINLRMSDRENGDALQLLIPEKKVSLRDADTTYCNAL